MGVTVPVYCVTCQHSAISFPNGTSFKYFLSQQHYFQHLLLTISLKRSHKRIFKMFLSTKNTKEIIFRTVPRFTNRLYSHHILLTTFHAHILYFITINLADGFLCIYITVSGPPPSLTDLSRVTCYTTEVWGCCCCCCSSLEFVCLSVC